MRDLKRVVRRLRVGKRNQSEQDSDGDGEAIESIADTFAEATGAIAFARAASNRETDRRSKCKCAGYTH